MANPPGWGKQAKTRPRGGGNKSRHPPGVGETCKDSGGNKSRHPPGVGVKGDPGEAPPPGD